MPKEIFLQLTKYLQDFTKNNNVIFVATYPPFFGSKQRKFFTEVLCSRANIVSSIKKFRNRPYFILEKHPVFKTGKVELSSKETTLTDFSKPKSDMQKVMTGSDNSSVVGSLNKLKKGVAEAQAAIFLCFFF